MNDHTFPPASIHPRRFRLLLVVALILAGLLGNLLGGMPKSASGQNLEEWAPPVNLSRSGGTQSPHLVVDSDRTVHLLWEDLYAGFMYTRGDGQAWDSPIPLDLSFVGYDYKLVADTAGWIYAFWIDPDFNLYLSGARGEAMGSETAWFNDILLAESVAGFDVTVDSRNNLHIVYTLAADSDGQPAGIYYSRTLGSVQGWQSPKLIFESRYYRTLLPPPGDRTATATLPEPAHLSINTITRDDTVRVYLGWDNSALKRVYFSSSVDSGSTFSDPTIVDGPDSTQAYKIAQQLHIESTDSSMLQVWQVTEPGGTCQLVYRSSSDDGQTWGIPSNVLGDIVNCPSEVQYFKTDDNKLLAFATLQGQIYLYAWNGSQWSELLNQGELNSFSDPDTFNVVEFGCQTSALRSNQLVVAGCDLGTSDDIWVTSRELGNTNEWFTTLSGWSNPIFTEIGEGEITSLSAIADPSGVVHALWSSIATVRGSQPISSLQHASWSTQGNLNGQFTLHTLREGTPNGMTSLLTAAPYRIISMWKGERLSQVEFSWSEANLADSRSSWTEPLALQPNNPIGESPTLALAQDGTIYAAYSIPFNESRGIFLTFSTDRGNTWSEARQVFDGTTSNCEHVLNPSLAVNGSSTLHLMWTCATLPGGIGPLELFYARSLDGGVTWPAADLVSSRPVVWNKVVGVGEDIVYRIWREMEGNQASLWSSASTDGGETWQPPINFVLIESEAGPTALTVDSNGQIHLLQVVPGNEGKPQTNYLVWSGSSWEPRQSFSLRLPTVDSVSNLAVVVSSSGQLAAIYTGLASSLTGGEPVNQLGYAALKIAENQELPAVEATPTPQSEAVSETQAVTQTAIIATPTLNPADLNEGPPAGNNTFSIVIGIAFSLLVIAGAFALNTIIQKSRRH